MSDLIERQAVVDTFENAVDILRKIWAITVGNIDRDQIKFCIGLMNAGIDDVKALPSAQPEIIRCKDCIYFDQSGWCDYLETSIGMNDFCSRAKRRTDEQT